MVLFDEMRHDVDGQREDDGGVLLRGDARQRLQIAELNVVKSIYARAQADLFLSFFLSFFVNEKVVTMSKSTRLTVPVGPTGFPG